MRACYVAMLAVDWLRLVSLPETLNEECGCGSCSWLVVSIFGLKGTDGSKGRERVSLVLVVGDCKLRDRLYLSVSVSASVCLSFSHSLSLSV